MSALGELNARGYGIALLAGLALWWGFGRSVCGSFPWKLSVGKLRWRCGHAFPAIFLLLACLTGIGGLLYPPNNYDALTYRVPRVLHWLAEGRWHWIATCEQRMNISAVGMEWLMAPLVSLTGSDRFFFLINWISYALLPGLVYATFARLGVNRRQAWVWMWLFPCAYGLVLQAGSIGNDAFAVTYFLASICFTLEFRKSGKAADFYLGMLAAALLTGSKASNLPLLLPWALAALPGVRLLKTRPLGICLTTVVCITISFLPVAWQNVKHTGDWTGDPLSRSGMKLTNPWHGLLGNGLQWICQNGVPPIMPAAKLWNAKVNDWTQSPALQPLIHDFPRLSLACAELQQEEVAGLGLGLSTLLLVTLFAALRRSPGKLRPAASKLLICLGGWVALTVYMLKMGSESGARLLLPYYPLLTASVLFLPTSANLARKCWWRTLACLAALSALPAVVLTPSRPLWPAVSATEKLASACPGNALVARIREVYRVYHDRNDALAPLRKHLAPEDRIVGFLGEDDPQVSLWRPFGLRRVVEIPPHEPPLLLKRPWRMVARRELFPLNFSEPMEKWVYANGGRVIASEWIITKASRGPQQWFVIQFDPL
ncbi:MAG: hypothetical protein NTZ46_07610 [Verrucomicrobia bacterium]|nr:hypothetical protein [Verrucomicrobiota bacterium]